MKLLKIFLLIHLLCFLSEASNKEIKALIKKGVEHQNNRQCTHAIKAFKKVVKLKPQMYKLYNRIAYCFNYLGFEDVSIKYYKKTLDFDPQDSYALKTLKSIYKKRREIQSNQDTQEILDVGIEDNSLNLVNHSMKMFYLQNGDLYYSDMNGSFRRKFAEFSIGRIFPNGSKKGVATLIEIESIYQKLHFYDFIQSEFYAVADEVKSVANPFYSDTRDRIVFLSISKDGQSKKLMQVEPKLDVKAELLLKDFYSIDEYKLMENSQNLYFIGRKKYGLNSRIYKMDKNDKIEQLTFIGGDFSKLDILKDETYLVCNQKNSTLKYNLLLLNLTNKLISNITHNGFDEITGIWGSSNQTIYYSASNIDLSEKWSTSLVKYEREAGFASKLVESSFLQEDLYIDDQESYIYLRSSYDSNYEVYRFKISSPKRERLTISDEDENHLRFMLLHK
ncbi:hypothetical protein MJH12_14290 [bacterium]|nr:hypothetical protein [bacterium]